MLLVLSAPVVLRLRGTGARLEYGLLCCCLAIAAYKRGPSTLALGIAAHGLLWDSWHQASHYMPRWYAHGCLLVDIGLSLYVWLQRERLAAASRATVVAAPSQTQRATYEQSGAGPRTRP